MTTDAASPADTAEHLGPVSYLAIEFPDGRPARDGFRKLTDLVTSGLVLVIDLEFIRRSRDGTLTTVPADSLGLGDDLAMLAGSDSGLLDRDDLELVAGDLGPDGLLAVLVYEDLVLEPVLAAWAAGGGRLVAEGPVAVDDLEAALDAEDVPTR